MTPYEKWIIGYWKLVDTLRKSLRTLKKKLSSRNDDEYIDRLSSRHTTFMLFFLTACYLLLCYRFASIVCFVPRHFKRSHIRYVNSYCWVRNTYYVPMDERLPKADEPREHVIPYYQWVPFILMGQALLFYLPSLFWHGLNQQGGVDCDSILACAHKLTNQLLHSGTKNKDKVLRRIYIQMSPILDLDRHKKQGAGMKCSIRNIVNTLCQLFKYRSGNYLVVLFLFSKVLYLVNVIGQLFLLNAVLATRYHLYGFEIMEYLLSDADWTESPGVVFPRVTLCDFDIRRLGNIHRYTVQCVLRFNLYIEKFYMFLWFWLVFLAVVTTLGLIVWTMRAISRSDKVKFVSNHLMEITEHERKMVPDFVGNYLGHDGVFLLRLIAHNTNNISVTEIVDSLFVMYKKDN